MFQIFVIPLPTYGRDISIGRSNGLGYDQRPKGLLALQDHFGSYDQSTCDTCHPRIYLVVALLSLHLCIFLLSPESCAPLDPTMYSSPDLEVASEDSRRTMPIPLIDFREDSPTTSLTGNQNYGQRTVQGLHSFNFDRVLSWKGHFNQ
jgi:hypothetical protein